MVEHRRTEYKSSQTQEYETDIKGVTKSFYILPQKHSLQYLLDMGRTHAKKTIQINVH